jgi:hypothetical protein
MNIAESTAKARPIYLLAAQLIVLPKFLLTHGKVPPSKHETYFSFIILPDARVLSARIANECRWSPCVTPGPSFLGGHLTEWHSSMAAISLKLAVTSRERNAKFKSLLMQMSS